MKIKELKEKDIERYTLSNEYYIMDNLKNKHLTLEDACKELNNKDNIILRMFKAITKKE